MAGQFTFTNGPVFHGETRGPCARYVLTGPAFPVDQDWNVSGGDFVQAFRTARMLRNGRRPLLRPV